MAAGRWSSKTMGMRAGLLRGSIYWVLLFWGRFLVAKALSQIKRNTHRLVQGLSPRPLHGGFGLGTQPAGDSCY